MLPVKKQAACVLKHVFRQFGKIPGCGEKRGLRLQCSRYVPCASFGGRSLAAFLFTRENLPAILRRQNAVQRVVPSLRDTEKCSAWARLAGGASNKTGALLVQRSLKFLPDRISRHLPYSRRRFCATHFLQMFSPVLHTKRLRRAAGKGEGNSTGLPDMEFRIRNSMCCQRV